MKFCGCLALIGMFFLSTGAISLADDNRKVVFEEKFTVPLGAGWTWIRENPKAWKVDDGTLLLRVLPG